MNTFDMTGIMFSLYGFNTASAPNVPQIAMKKFVEQVENTIKKYSKSGYGTYLKELLKNTNKY